MAFSLVPLAGEKSYSRTCCKTALLMRHNIRVFIICLHSYHKPEFSTPGMLGFLGFPILQVCKF
jgi:hypothetical protein